MQQDYKFFEKEIHLVLQEVVSFLEGNQGNTSLEDEFHLIRNNYIFYVSKLHRIYQQHNLEREKRKERN